MKQDIETITPQMADEILQRQKGNRSLSERNVAFLLDQMKEGKWQITHQGICLDKNENLLDGQHRLQAIVRYGKPVKMLVTRDMDPEIFKVIDVGKPRSAADIFHIKGFRNWTDMPPLVGKVLRWYKNGDLSGNHKHKIATDVLLDYAKKYELQLHDAISYGRTHQHSLYPRSFAAFWYYVFYYEDRQDYIEILDQLITGKTVSDYVIGFREELVSNRIKKLNMKKNELARRTLLALISEKKGKLIEATADIRNLDIFNKYIVR